MVNTLIHGSKKQKGQAQRPHIAPDDLVSTSWFGGLYGLAEGEIDGLADGGKSIKLDGTPLINDNGQANFTGINWEFRTGTLDQTHIAGFPAVENETNVGVELRSDRPWVKAITNRELSAVRVRLNFNSLREQKDNGDIVGYAISYAIDVQTDGGSFQEVLRQTVRGKSSQGYKKSHRIDLPNTGTTKRWTIRVRRITPNRNSELISDTVHIDALTEIIDAKLAYPCTALLGLSYDAKTFANIAKLAVRLKGKIIQVPSNYNAQTRTYTGLWDGTFKMAYSNNPAWVYYDLCTHKRYGLGERLEGMVDKWRLYQIGQYCDELVDDGKGGQEPRFTVNVYIQQADDAYRVLQNLASVFRGLSFWDGSNIIVDSDTPKEPVYTFSPANVVGGEFAYTGTRARDRHTLAKVAWDNPENNFTTEYELIPDEQAIAKYGVRTLDISAFGCTSRGQTQRAGLWALKAEQLETQTVSFKTGLMGFIPQVGQVVNVADNVFAGRAISGKIMEVSTNKRQITLDRSAAKVGDTLTVNGTDGIVTAKITAVHGQVLTLDKPVNAESENIWAVISDDLKLKQFRILTIAQNDDTTFDITALEYNAQKYAAVDSTAVVVPQPYTVLKATPINAPNTVTLTASTRTVQGQAVTTLSINWEQVQGATAYIVKWRKDDGNWQTLPKVSGQSVDIDGVYAGNYTAQVQAVDAFDNESLATTSTLTAITGKVGKPPRLAGLAVQGILFGMNLSWTFARGSDDTNFTEIQVSPDGRSNIATLGTFAYPTNKHEITGLQGNLTQYYRARIVDKLGNTSDWTAWVSATTSANPQAVLDILQGQINESTLNNLLIHKINTVIQVGNSNTQAIQAETTARTQAIQAEMTARNNAIRTEATIRTQAIQEESITRTTEINAKANEIRNALQNGLTQEIQQRKDADNSTISALNAYKTSNDSAVATVLQKADSAISTNTAQTNQINSLQSNLNVTNQNVTKKLDASVITNYYTKTQADEKIQQVTTGKIEEFNASLRYPPVNLFARITAVQGYLTHGNPTLISTQSGNKEITSDYIMVNKGIYTYQVWAKNMQRNDTMWNAYYLYDENKNAIGGRVVFKGSDIIPTQIGQEVYYSFQINIPENAKYIRLSSRHLVDGKVQFELGAKPSAFIPHVLDVHHSVEANAQAISTLNSNVSYLNQNITSQSSQITQFRNDLNSTNTNVSRKADSTALSTLDNKVTQHGNNITAQANKITQLENNLNTTNQNLNTKASAIVLSTLDNRVNNLDGRVSTQANQITQLNNNLTTTNHQTLDALKLSAMITNGKLLYPDVNFKQGLNNVRVYNNSGNGAVVIERIAKRANNPTSSSHELKITRKINLTSSPNLAGFYQIIQSAPNKTFVVKYLICLPVGYHINVNSNATGNGSIDKIIGSTAGTGKYETYLRCLQCGDTGNFSTTGHISISGTVPTTEDLVWYLAQIECYEITDYQSVDNTVQQFINNATTALTTLTNNQQSQSQQLTSLQNSLNATNTNVNKKADTTALTALDNKVTQQGNNITTQGSKITQLENSLNMVNQTLSTKANSTALNTLDSKVMTLNNTVNSQGQSITQLNNSLNATNANVSKKADSTALTALDNKVTQQGNSITSQASQITQLNSNLTATNNQTLDAVKMAGMINNGKLLFTDVNFKNGNNGVTIYNNSGGTGVVIERIAKRANNPTSSTHELKITRSANATTSPSLGGFYQLVQSAPNKTFLIKYLICLPVGYSLVPNANATGNGRIDKFIGSVAGTGKYETYLRYIQCGDTGSFSTTGFVSAVGAGNVDLIWYLAQIECYEITDYQSVDGTVQQFMSNATQSLTTLTNNQQTQSQQLTSLQNSLNSTNANVNTKASTTALNTLQSQVTMIDGKVNTQATQYTSLSSTVNSQATTITQQAQTINGISAVRAVTVDNNGVISGYGLMSELKNGRVTSQFGVNADTFYIGSPSNNKKPFIFNASPRVIDGVQYPAGAWINSACIANATIKMAHIDKASISSLSSITATIGTLRTKTTGARTEIKDNLIEVYDDKNRLRVKLGVW